MTAFSLTQFSMLGPYADVSLLFGPMLREDVRTDPGGRPMLVAETLASWATAGSLASFATAHRRLPLLVSEALKEHVLPIQLSAAITAFPAMLRDLDARFAWSDATKSASVLRFDSLARSTRSPPSMGFLRARPSAPSSTRRAMYSHLSCQR